MLITNAILGLLSYEDLSGYDLKKKIQGNIYFPWSGNNNQVYKALSELLDKNFVVSENIIQNTAPAKKVYSITSEGREQLKNYAKSSFGQIQISKPFLLRLLSAVDLSKDEMLEIIEVYRNQLLIDISIVKQRQSLADLSNVYNLENYILDSINTNELQTLELELGWLEKLELGLDNINFKTKQSSTSNAKIKQITQKTLNFEVKENCLLYSVKLNGLNNTVNEKNIKEIIISVIENNCTSIYIELGMFTKESLTKDLLELMMFECTKYNISVEIK